ncbi:RN215-like protein [Mya arenaria]|uniref:RN215-like protein n=1 Tax=Mya arenaria TaxID=6604 RepID=A0ABY7E5F6_MYAAR|nr:RN215-like protein [Mya arenaria]
MFSFRRNYCFVSLLYFMLVIPAFTKNERVTLIEVGKLEKTSNKRLTAGDHSSGTTKIKDIDGRFWGKLLDVGREDNVDGRLHLLPCNCIEDESSVARLPSGWVAVLNYTDLSVCTVTAGECPGVMDRMKKALFFGASAIIILAMNPKFIKEKYYTTVTLWGTCGRYSGRSYHEWDGVVCMGQHEAPRNKDGKVDVEHFWNYFYTAVLVLMMIHYIRTRREQAWENPDYIDETLRELAYRALAVMKIKRYTKEGTNDSCAICLEKFYLKQKLRVLPCSHFFHTKCVDPWLVRNHTCPLCKLNIIDSPLVFGQFWMNRSKVFGQFGMNHSKVFGQFGINHSKVFGQFGINHSKVFGQFGMNHSKVFGQFGINRSKVFVDTALDRIYLLLPHFYVCFYILLLNICVP